MIHSQDRAANSPPRLLPSFAMTPVMPQAFHRVGSAGVALSGLAAGATSGSSGVFQAPGHSAQTSSATTQKAAARLRMPLLASAARLMACPPTSALTGFLCDARRTASVYRTGPIVLPLAGLGQSRGQITGPGPQEQRSPWVLSHLGSRCSRGGGSGI